MTDYSSKARALELNGDLYVSVWTFAGFNGKVAGTVLDGKGNFYLPPGLKQLLDIDKVSLPVKVDLKAMDKSVKQLEGFLKELEDKTKQFTQQAQKPSKGYTDYIG